MRMIRTLIFAAVFSASVATANHACGQRAVKGEPSLGGHELTHSFGDSNIVLKIANRFAGAVYSITWRGKEFVDSADHGRLLQSAASFDNTPEAGPETFNPTEAGSRRDGDGPRSTSQLLGVGKLGGTLMTRTRMAFWLAPGERSAGQLARNPEPLSRHILTKYVTIGTDGAPNVIDYSVAFEVPEGEPHTTAQFEALTGYMPAEFSSFYRFVRETGQIELLSDGPGEQADPVVFSTPDGRYAMGIICTEPASPRAQGPGYGRFRFVEEKVVKWNCVFRVRDGVPPGPHRFRMFVPMGTRDDVVNAMRALARPSGAAK